MRRALVVGVNTYSNLGHLSTPANDAEAIAHRLEQSGNFTVKRLPDVQPSEAIKIGQTTPVFRKELRKELQQLFNPANEKEIPDTALFYFSGHGIQINKGSWQESQLVTSETDPDVENGYALQDLRQLLEGSPVKQKIIWLDCCHSGSLLDLSEADPGYRGRGRDLCFIAAAYQEAYLASDDTHSFLTSILLKALTPSSYLGGRITNLFLAEFLDQELQTNPKLRNTPQRPIFANLGGSIDLIPLRNQPNPNLPHSGSTESICPYKGLNFFDYEGDDPKYFFGRTALTDKLLQRVSEGNFLVVTGASGSGKSSVVRAGLIYQLNQGLRRSGTNQWKIHILRPGTSPRRSESPLKNLARAFVNDNLSKVKRAEERGSIEKLLEEHGGKGLGRLVDESSVSRVLLVVDQFEEIFSSLIDETERRSFISCLLEAINNSAKLCLVLVMRSDFISSCMEQDYTGLAIRMEGASLETVAPMTEEELQEAIVEPAKQMGVDVEPRLIKQMKIDVADSAASLPLVQYTLTELWYRSQNQGDNRLTFADYLDLGGIQQALEKRANQVYDALTSNEQQIAQRIFLQLTQPGEDTEPTRRQVNKQSLITSPESAAIVDRVLQKLVDEKLIVTSALSTKGAESESEQIPTVEVAHEALIRYWSKLRQWLYDNQDALRTRLRIEKRAQEWKESGKPLELAYLLQGTKLAEAEEFIDTYGDDLPLQVLAQEFVRVSQAEGDRLEQQEKERHQREKDTLNRLLQEQEEKASAEAEARKASNKAQVEAEAREKAERIAKEEEKKKTRNAKIAAGLAIAALVSFGFFQQQLWENELTVSRAMLGLIKAKDLTPKNLQDTLKIAKENAQRGNIDSALELYGEIRKSIGNETEFEFFDGAAKNEIVDLVKTYKMPVLEKYLKDSKIGEKIIDETKSDPDKRFTEGALRETYKIVMIYTGTDLNPTNGEIDEKEVEKMPCDILLAIEKLWRNHTKQTCGWVGSNTDYGAAPDCQEAELKGVSLGTALFDPVSFQYLLYRYQNQCKS
ncbi:caspase family protein [Phormidium sp. CLA17]|uniref:nSTAND1 domain-containing NTPase n=1 Tax=Leptolyngbya sp. Cla-17 TaxID=2803751 RepID=UPI001492B4C5|nr:caspase family protein [Leptolyngbya sp. Cla-17]MBM0742878.1 caspase family protein [Leptolyngbya sp. Cla-17]